MNKPSEKVIRYAQGNRINALAIFDLLNISIDQDFHTLSSDQVEKLLDEAKRVRYQKPANANGSTARYFFARLQRQAKWSE